MKCEMERDLRREMKCEVERGDGHKARSPRGRYRRTGAKVPGKLERRAGHPLLATSQWRRIAHFGAPRRLVVGKYRQGAEPSRNPVQNRQGLDRRKCQASG